MINGRGWRGNLQLSIVQSIQAPNTCLRTLKLPVTWVEISCSRRRRVTKFIRLSTVCTMWETSPLFITNETCSVSPLEFGKWSAASWVDTSLNLWMNWWITPDWLHLEERHWFNGNLGTGCSYKYFIKLVWWKSSWVSNWLCFKPWRETGTSRLWFISFWNIPSE